MVPDLRQLPMPELASYWAGFRQSRCEVERDAALMALELYKASQFSKMNWAELTDEAIGRAELIYQISLAGKVSW